MIGNLDPDEKEEEGDPKETSVVDRRSFVRFFFPFSLNLEVQVGMRVLVCVLYK